MKILVVDDDNVDRMLLEKLVAKHGHEPIVASNGKEAVDKYRAGGIAMVLIDWMMPGVDGIRACKEIRALDRELNQDSYIIMITSKTGKDDFLEAVSAGVDEFLPKPIDEQTLWARIRTGERILNTSHDVEKKSEELKGLWNQLILHNVGLRGQIKTIKDRVDKSQDHATPHHRPEKSDLESGEAYLVECPHNGDAPAFKLFAGEVGLGFPGLVLSRTHPAKVKKLYDLQDIEVIWLSKGFARSGGNSCLPLNLMATGASGTAGAASDENLAAILEVIREFLEGREGAVALFSGVEYLFARFSQNSVLEMLYGLSEVVKGCDGKIIIACHPAALDPVVVALLKREMVWVPYKVTG